MPSKYIASKNLLTAIQRGPTSTKLEPKQLVKTLTQKGYIERTARYQKTGADNYDLTEKGDKTLQEYNKIRKIRDKIREGSHPSTGHPDR